jgi:hypothetical protein
LAFWASPSLWTHMSSCGCQCADLWGTANIPLDISITSTCVRSLTDCKKLEIIKAKEIRNWATGMEWKLSKRLEEKEQIDTAKLWQVVDFLWPESDGRTALVICEKQKFRHVAVIKMCPINGKFHLLLSARNDSCTRRKTPSPSCSTNTQTKSALNFKVLFTLILDTYTFNTFFYLNRLKFNIKCG